jgi:hypothetical protein
VKHTLVTLATLPLLLAGCSSDGGTAKGTSPTSAAPDAITASSTPTNGASTGGATGCGTLPTADPAAELPAGFPALPGQVLYEPSTQGTTRIVFGLVQNASFTGVRDELVTQLKGSGYSIEGTDQESVEAEAEFGGKQSGTVKVQPVCDGYVSVRYKFNG